MAGDDKMLEIVSNGLNGMVHAISILHKCLLNEGALQQGQYLNDLKATLNDSDAQFERYDYVVLRLLAQEIERSEIEDRTA